MDEVGRVDIGSGRCMMVLYTEAACERTWKNNIETMKTWGSNPGHVLCHPTRMPLSQFTHSDYIIQKKQYKIKQG